VAIKIVDLNEQRPEPPAWPYDLTEDINIARAEARTCADETAETYGLYYRGHRGGKGTGQPWRDLWSAAPSSAAPLSQYGPCELYEPHGRSIALTIF
jgi:hypothetical protein